MNTGSSRRYEMRKRAEKVAQTRQRIVDAAVRLHTSVGPARTTIAGIADEAGVTRATVYSHFADDVELFTACSGQWLVDHPRPEFEGWVETTDPIARATRVFDDLYRWYEANADDLRVLLRDMDAAPPAAVDAWMAMDADVAAIVLGGPPAGVLGALASHLVSFPTWDSLTTSLGHAETVDLAVRLLQAIE